MLPWLIVTGAPSLGSNLTLWPVWGMFVRPQPEVGWTLCFEVLFYLGTTLALATRPVVAFALLAGALGAAQFTSGGVQGFVGNPIILEFIFGLIITKLPKREFLGLPLIVVGSMGIFIAPTALYDSTSAIDPSLSPFRVLYWGVPSAFIVYGALSIEKRFQGWRVSILLGDASYSIYLFHVIVTSGLIVWWPVKAIVAISVGMVAHFGIERPLLRLPHDLTNWYRTRMAQTA